MLIVKSMPMKQINVNSEVYMQRYYAGRFSDDKDLWLHRFLSCDGEKHLHNHPFEFETIVINGGYTEELGTDGEDKFNIRIARAGFDFAHCLKVQLGVLSNPIRSSRQTSEVFKWRMGGNSKPVSVFDWHRIAAIEEMTWTAVVVDHRRLPQWYFQDGNGITPVGSSPRDWWKDYKVRPESGVCAGNDDNRIVRF
jgi:hypothetical protein